MFTVEDLTARYLKFRTTRFPDASMWMCGNCFQYACIVSGWLSVHRMLPHVFYDAVHGHFMVGVYLDTSLLLFDWSGVVCVDTSSCEYSTFMKYFVDWETYREVDPLHYARIVRDCCT